MVTCINSYLEYLRKVRRYSDNTIRNYDFALNAFVEFCSNNGTTIADAIVNDVREWICSLHDSGILPQSVNVRLSALRSFYDYMCIYEGWQSNPCALVRNLKTEKILPKFIPADKLNYIIDNVLPKSTWKEKRSWAVVLFLFHTGCRCSELCGMRVGDVDFSSMSLRIVGKGNKERILPFSTELGALLHHLIKSDELRPSSFLFRQTSGESLEPWQVRAIVKMALSKSVAPSLAFPHVIRHSFATALLNSGANIEAIRVMLGHASVTTTQIYTHLSFVSLNNIYSKCFCRT